MKNFKKYLVLSLSLNILLAFLFVFQTYQKETNTPYEYIKGTYQSTEFLPDLYDFVFFENEFYLKYNGEVLEKGAYEKYKKNIFVCYGENSTQVITLLNKEFYIYDSAHKRVVTIRKVSNTPTTISSDIAKTNPESPSFTANKSE